MARWPMGVEPPGVMSGVCWPDGVMALGVIDGVIEGVIPILGVMLGVAFDGVSSQRERRLLAAPGVEDSMIPSLWRRSAFGVSAQPLLWPGVSRSVFGVSSQRLRRVDFSLATGSLLSPWWPGVMAEWAGVASQMRVVAGVAPGVSLPL